MLKVCQRIAAPTMSILSRFSILSMILLLCTPLYAAPIDMQWSPHTYQKERQTFLAAEKALKQGKSTQYQALLKQLKHYPLMAYLESEQLKAKSKDLSYEEVAQYQKKYPDSALSPLLYHQWLRYQATLERWQNFREHYNDEPNLPVDLQCQHLWAEYQHTSDKAVLEAVKPLWLVDHQQPPACRRLFDAWEKLFK